MTARRLNGQPESRSSSTVHRPPFAFAAAFAVILVVGLASGAVAQGSETSPVGDWRPYWKIGDQLGILDGPELLPPVDCEPQSGDCKPQGTFKRDPYYRVQPSGDGTLVLTSDAGFSAILEAMPGAEGVYAVRLPGGATAKLEMGSPACKGKDPCFEVTGMPGGQDLTDNIYVWRPHKAPNEMLDQTLGSVFASMPPNFDLVRTCYDITKLDPDDLAERHCTKSIFAAPAMDKSYESHTLGDGHLRVVPYGWDYLPTARGSGGKATHILESGADLQDSLSRTVGWKTGLNLVIVDMSVHHNKTTQERAQRMYESKLTYSEFEYLETQFALVLDKWNVLLDPDFSSEVMDLSLKKGATAEDYRRFVEQWGTHYAYATTMGERGKLVSTFTQDQVVQLHDQSVNVASGASFGMSIPLQEFGIPGSAGASLGVDDGSGKYHYQKMTEIVGQDLGKFRCSGGLTCSGTNASGGNVVPVLLDLRPLSDLVGPPFFDGEEDIQEIKETLAQTIAKYIFDQSSPVRDEPAARFLRISGPVGTRCNLWTAANPGGAAQKLPLESCSIANLSFATDSGAAAATTANGSPVWVAPAPDSLTTTLPSGSIVSVLSMSADATIPGVVCSSDPPQPALTRRLKGLANFLVPPRLTACFILQDTASQWLGSVPAGCTATGSYTVAANVELISGEALFDPRSLPPTTPPDERLCGGR